MTAGLDLERYTMKTRVKLFCASVFLIFLSSALAPEVNSQEPAEDTQSREFHCFENPMSADETESAIRTAVIEHFNVRRVEMVGNTYIRHIVLLRRLRIYEGDIFVRRSLVDGLESINALNKMIYPVAISDLHIRLDRERKIVDLSICLRERPEFNAIDFTAEKRLIEDIGQRFANGNRSVVKEMLISLPALDGWLAEEMDDLFSKMLCRDPELLLEVFAARHESERNNLVFITASWANCEDNAATRKKLKLIADRRQGVIAEIAIRIADGLQE